MKNKLFNKIAGWFGYKIIEKKLHKNNRLIDRFSTLKTESLISTMFKKNLISKIVQIGANDGERFDLLKKILGRQNIKALLVEPINESFQKLKLKYADTENIFLENSAISVKNLHNEMYLLNPNFAKLYDDHVPGISSFNKSHLLKHGVKNKHIIKKKINSISVKNLLEKHDFLDLDLLYIDAEGYDGEILLDFFNFTNKKPIVIFEYIHISHNTFYKLLEILNKNGYKILRADENLVVINKEITLEL